MPMSKAVYRAYDNAGALLYIGATRNKRQRMSAHEHSSPWWARACRVDFRDYQDAARADRIEGRAIRLLRPEFNVMGQVDQRARRTVSGAGMAAAKAAGRSFGRPHFIRDFPKRMALLRRMDQAGVLRDADGELIGSAARLMEKLNSADKQAPVIGNAETVRRFKREGFPGVDQDDDDSLDLDDK